MKITSMQKMIAVAVGIALIAVLVVVLVILPQFGQLDELAAARQTADMQRQQAQAVLAQLEEAKTRSAMTEAQLLKIGTMMPDSPQLPTLIIELQDIANAAGVQVTSFSPAQPAVAGGGQYTEISMTTQLTSTWDNLLDYMRRLNSTTRLLRVTNVTINPASVTGTQTAGEAIPLTVALTMKAYVIGTNGVVSSGAVATATPAPQQ
jgi:type IV pilus assembly protein PilO